MEKKEAFYYKHLAKRLLLKFKDSHENELGRFLANDLFDKEPQPIYESIKALWEEKPDLNLFTFFAHLEIKKYKSEINDHLYSQLMDLYSRYNPGRRFKLNQNVFDFFTTIKIDNLELFTESEEASSYFVSCPVNLFEDVKESEESRVFVVGDDFNTGIFFVVSDDAGKNNYKPSHVFEIINLKNEVAGKLLNYVLWFILVGKSHKDHLLNVLSSLYKDTRVLKRIAIKSMVFNNSEDVYDVFNLKVYPRHNYVTLVDQKQTQLTLNEIYQIFIRDIKTADEVRKHEHSVDYFYDLVKSINQLMIDQKRDYNGLMTRWFDRTLNKNIEMCIDCLKLYRDIHLLKKQSTIFDKIISTHFNPYREIDKFIELSERNREHVYYLYNVRNGIRDQKTQEYLDYLKRSKPPEYEEFVELSQLEFSILKYYSMIEKVYKTGIFEDSEGNLDLEKLLNSALSQHYGDLGFNHPINFPKFLVKLGATLSPYFNQIERLDDHYFSNFINYYFDQKNNIRQLFNSSRALNGPTEVHRFHFAKSCKVHILLEQILKQKESFVAQDKTSENEIDCFIHDMLLRNSYLTKKNGIQEKVGKVLTKYGYNLERVYDFKTNYVNLVETDFNKLIMSFVIDQDSPENYVNLEMIHFKGQVALGIQYVKNKEPDDHYYEKMGTISLEFLNFFLKTISQQSIGKFLYLSFRVNDNYHKIYKPFVENIVKNKIIMDDL